MLSFAVPPDRYLQINGIKTRYWQMGNHGSTLILLHGGTASIEVWVYTIAVLAKYHRVYAFDMVGSGKSDRPSASYSLRYQAKFLRDFMSALDISIATLIGTSMGGGVALQFTLIYPDLINKLILVNSMGFGREISYKIRLMTLPGVAKIMRPARWMISGMLKSNVHDRSKISSEWIEFGYKVFALPDRMRTIVALSRTNFNLQGVRPKIYLPILNNLSQIKQQTLIVWGEDDRIIPVKHAKIAASKIPNSKLKLFSQCGHLPYLEYRNEFNQSILDFLGREISSPQQVPFVRTQQLNRV